MVLRGKPVGEQDVADQRRAFSYLEPLLEAFFMPIWIMQKVELGLLAA